MLDRLAAYWYSLRYQHPRQILNRARYWLAWQVYPRFPSLVRAWCEPAARRALPHAGFTWPQSPSDPPTAHGHLGANRFRFLKTADLGECINWNAAGRSLLWRFHLHYFDWAQSGDPEILAGQIKSWIESNPPGSWPGWHPYPTSLRIVNWIRAFARGTTPSGRMVQSLATQAAFLERNLEFHLGGNHLLENARALLVAGLYLQGPHAARWKSLGLDLLLAELRKQVLPDGGHIERSPFYHRRMTALVREVVALLTPGGVVPAELIETAERMEAFDRAMRHQDGGLPLFHDFVDAPISDPSPPNGAASFPSTGYYILETSSGRLIADYGAPGAFDNPAHQHAGIFSFEISSGRRRVIVDSGTPTYEPGAERERLRSTAAHNTVRVDACDQFQVWDAFRVGRRAWVSPVEERRGPDFHSISAAHNGYRRLGVEHRRTIVCIPEAGWLIVDDLTGHGPHRMESFIHFHPELQPRVDSDIICLPPLGWTVTPFGAFSRIEIIDNIYSPEAGIRKPSRTAVLQAGSELPCRFGYLLGPGPADRRLIQNVFSAIAPETKLP